MKNGLLVEDLPPSQDWLRGVVEQTFPGIGVTVVDTLAAARQALAARLPDIALIDLGLPDGDGTDLVCELTHSAPEVVTVVTTVFDDDEHVFAALRAGAQGYVLKDQFADQLGALLAGIVAGRPPLSPAIAMRLLRHFHDPGNEPSAHLSAREREVLTLIAKGCTVARVGELLGITRNTAAGYVKEIYRKLNVSSRAEATLEASRRGML